MGTGGEALDLLAANLRATGSCGVDIVLKEHDPPTSNAARFLKKLRAVEALASLPVIGEAGGEDISEQGEILDI